MRDNLNQRARSVPEPLTCTQIEIRITVLLALVLMAISGARHQAGGE